MMVILFFACALLIAPSFGLISKESEWDWEASDDCAIVDGETIQFQDPQDGNQKQITRSNGKLTFKPYNNQETWSVTTTLDVSTCTTVVNFNVPGKPNPPKNDFVAAFWTLTGGPRSKVGVSFANKSAPSTPVNLWIQVIPQMEEFTANPDTCAIQPDDEIIFRDMTDEDYKSIELKGYKLTIKPYDNNQTWVVTSDFDEEYCESSINFNVPHKPNPPAGPILGVFYTATKLSDTTTVVIFSQTATSTPLNSWVETGSPDIDDDSDDSNDDFAAQLAAVFALLLFV